MSDLTAKPLLPTALDPLPLGAIRPTGWLLRQLQIQAEGLGGHLDEFWPDVARSRWIGGEAEGWERGPYWLDGAVPLAFLLNDERLIAKVRRWVDEILARQGDDGWLGPVHDPTDKRRVAHDPWPVFVALKALAQFHEATGDERIVPAMTRFLRMLDGLLDRQPLFDWGRFRWPDLALPIFWLYERTGEGWLLDLAEKSYRQSFDWGAHFASFPEPYRAKQRLDQIFPQELAEGNTFAFDHASHVVNNAMGIKQPGVWYRLSHNPADRDAARAIIATLDRYHGQPNGAFSGDEHLAGTSPSQGTELCAVVEYMFSLEILASITGDPALGDRLEQLAFNALPATFTPDMWAHQYVQQANQVQCAVVEDRVYTNNGPDANIYGLEPNFGCCTANMHQGWPKFAASLWMRSADGGLASVAYAPCVARALIGDAPVEVEVITDYPFDDTVRILVRAEGAPRFPLHLRVPAWAEGATLSIGGAGVVALTPGGYHREEREWAGETTLTLRLPMAVRAERRPSGGAALHYGALLLALNIDASWRQLRGEAPHADWELLPAEPWNYALALDPDAPASAVQVQHRPLGDAPFSPEGAPIIATAPALRVVGWGIEHGAAAPPPSVAPGEGAPERLTLMPYGCTNLRVAEFPLVEQA
jgi:DUF1680 family protein